MEFSIFPTVCKHFNKQIIKFLNSTGFYEYDMDIGACIEEDIILREYASQISEYKRILENIDKPDHQTKSATKRR